MNFTPSYPFQRGQSAFTVTSYSDIRPGVEGIIVDFDEKTVRLGVLDASGEIARIHKLPSGCVRHLP